MNNSCLLSTAYWPPIQYLSKFELHNSITIEQWEHYEKKTYRNRCIIYGPNGIQSLNVPIAKGPTQKTITKDARISYDTKWQLNHLNAIKTAYNSTPFFEFYIDDLIPIFEKKHTFLLDLNTEILNICMQWLNIDMNYALSTEYKQDGNFDDLRSLIAPKNTNESSDMLFNAVEYIQGFEVRHGFMPNLSVLDLVFNLGGEARINLLRTISKKNAT